MKKAYLFALAILILIQLAVPFHMISEREMVLKKGELFRFKTRPVDPVDPFQGRFVRLGMEKDYVLMDQDVAQALSPNQVIHAVVATDTNGYAYFPDGGREKPETTAYLKTRVTRFFHFSPPASEKSHVAIKIPFERYYMDEEKAPRAETLARDAARAGDCWVNVRVYKGKAVIEDVFVEGRSIRDLAARKDE